MTLLAKGRALARAWSVQLAAIGAALSGALLTIDPAALKSAWETMPPELRVLVPAHAQTWISMLLFVGVVIARGVPQPKVDQRLALVSTPAWIIAARAAVLRKITSIAIHCAATPEGREVTAAEVRRWHLAKGWADIGYHFFIRLDGTIEVGRALATAGAHVVGFNAHSIGICYAGGLAKDGKTGKDTRTPAQKAAFERLLLELKARWPNAEIKGHRDYSPDRNRDGRITRDEWIKECPSFDARAEYADFGK